MNSLIIYLPLFIVYRFGSQIVKHVTKVIEVKWLLRNGRVLAEDRGAVVVSNHQSSIDILGKIIVYILLSRLLPVIISSKTNFNVFNR